jgi:hypothetical protein
MPKHPRKAAARAEARRRQAAVKRLLDAARPHVPPSPAWETCEEWLRRLLERGEGAAGGKEVQP